MIGGLLAAAPASQQHPALQTLPDVPWDRRTKASPAEKHCAEMNKLYSLLPRVCLSVCLFSLFPLCLFLLHPFGGEDLGRMHILRSSCHVNWQLIFLS